MEDWAMATILVVDDQSVSRECTATLLRAQGYDVLRASSGDDALDLLDQCPADLALVDVMMPGMNGLQLLKELKRERDIRVLLVTGLTDPELNRTGRALGAEGVLVKAQFSPEQLLETVARALPVGIAAA
jgi:CheY-like chemotaxis protein